MSLCHPKPHTASCENGLGNSVTVLSHSSRYFTLTSYDPHYPPLLALSCPWNTLGTLTPQSPSCISSSSGCQLRDLVMLCDKPK